jgi:Mrp family chromosome partitioning ATPase
VSDQEKPTKDDRSFHENNSMGGGLSDGEVGQNSNRTDTHDLVRLIKSITVRKEPIGNIDRNIVSPHFYNSFNFPLLERNRPGVNLTIGVTSTNRREGKTLVVANLAVSLALAHQRETVVVDLNVRSPRLHDILGTSQSPGLIEALFDNQIEVSKTSVEHLYVLSAGNLAKLSVLLDPDTIRNEWKTEGTSMGLEHIAAFRDILYSLKQKFDFVIVDMPSIQEPVVPMALTHQMEGIIAVVSANNTTHKDVQKMFTKINQNQILGFVFNRMPAGFLH